MRPTEIFLVVRRFNLGLYVILQQTTIRLRALDRMAWPRYATRVLSFRSEMWIIVIHFIVHLYVLRTPNSVVFRLLIAQYFLAQSKSKESKTKLLMPCCLQKLITYNSSLE